MFTRQLRNNFIGLPRGTPVMFACLLVLGMLPLSLSAAEYNVNEKAGKKLSGNHVFEKVEGDEIILAENGKANVEIWVPENSSPVVSFAANELKTFLESSTGASFNIVKSRTGKCPAILLGNNVWSKILANVDPTIFPRDAFIIKRCGDVVVIAGNDDMTADPEKFLQSWQPTYERGTLFGVYHFLETFAGARFYFPGKSGTVIPQNKILKMPAVSIFEAPDYPIRIFAIYDGQWIEKMSDKEQRVLMNRLALRWRLETARVPNCHSLARSALFERFGESHPEYFSLLGDGKRDNVKGARLQPGHVCFSENNLKNEIYLDGEAFLTGKPADFRNLVPGKGLQYWDASCFTPGYFNIMPQDGLGTFEMCHCPDCAKFVKDKKDSDLVWNFICDIAEKLKKNHVPGSVTAMAYGAYRKLPDRDIPDNVIVQVATTGPWGEGDPVWQQKDFKIIEDWTKKLNDRKVYMWNYACNFPPGAIPDGVPPLSPRWVGKYYKGLAGLITGAFLEDETEYWLFKYLNDYVFMKVCWNTGTDVEELLKDHHEKMFGPAAEPVKRFYDRLEELWTEKGIRKIKETPLGPTRTMNPVNVIWDENYNENIINEFKGLFDQAEKLCANNAECLERVKFIHEQYLGEIIKVRNKYCATKREIEDLALEALPVAGDKNVMLDGDIGDKIWQDIPSVSLVPFKNPFSNTEMKGVPVKTSVKALWTPEKLYLAFECEEPSSPENYILECKSGSTDIWQDTSVEIFLTLDRNSGRFYQIIVNAAGENTSASVSIDKDFYATYDWKWKGGIESKAKIGNGKWTAEVAIPVEQFLKRSANKGDALIMNFARERNVKKPGENAINLYSWSPFAKSSFSELRAFGSVVFVDKLSVNKQIVSNGSFEKWSDKFNLPEGWGTWDAKKSGSIFYDNADFVNGSGSAKLSSPEFTRMELSQRVKLEPEKEYRLSFFVKTRNVEGAPSGGACAAVSLNSKLTMFPLNSYYTGNTGWIKQAFLFKTPADLLKENN